MSVSQNATEAQLRKRVEDLLVIVGNSLKKELAIVLEAQTATIANQKHIAKLRTTIDVLQTQNMNLVKGRHMHTLRHTIFANAEYCHGFSSKGIIRGIGCS